MKPAPTDGAVTEVTIYAADHPGLFSRLAGALAVAGANILEAKIFTLTDSTALDIFSVRMRPPAVRWRRRRNCPSCRR
ncbi:MAG: hypothetical protein H6842_03690 [Rhodospirillaceae bacterium]|nr:hypothetical protein [Rhodospirillaceae bacterium]